MDNYDLSPGSAHPKARHTLTEEFYWSSINENGPFGSDDGSDAFDGFIQWRQSDSDQSTLKYLDELLSQWGLPKFDIYELDTLKIQAYLIKNDRGDTSSIAEYIPEMKKHFEEIARREGKEFDEAEFHQIFENSNTGMGHRYLLGMDNAIIAVGFGQLVLERKIDEDIKNLTRIALKRELLPVMSNVMHKAKKIITND